MRYLTASHKEGIIPHVCTDPAEPFNLNAPLAQVLERAGGAGMPTEALAELRKGGVILHHGATLHASGANMGDQWRRAYAVHFIARGAGFDSVDRDLQRTAYCFQDWYASKKLEVMNEAVR